LKKDKHVIFDLDGTISDTNDVVIESLMFSVKRVLGYLPEYKLIEGILGKPLEEQVDFFSTELSSQLIDIYREEYRNREYKSKIFEGIHESLLFLKENGVLLSILSNKGMRGITYELKKHGISDFFDFILSKDDLEKRKPDPYGIFLLVERSGISLTNTIIVGDSYSDILCGNKAGIKSVLVDWTIIPRETFIGLEYLTIDSKNQGEQLLKILKK
jgi:pyrophosphatase PpaX